jgi:hypothetical protein
MCGQPLADVHTVCRHCGEAKSADSSLRRKFRWRIIPAFLLAAYGGVFLLGVILNSTLAELSDHFDGPGLPKSLLQVIPAIAFVAAARLWWKGRWWWAVGITILSYPVTVATMTFLSGR